MRRGLLHGATRIALLALGAIGCGSARADVATATDAVSYATCNDRTGLTAPLPPCTTAAPCTTPTGTVTEPITMPGCASAGGPRAWTDPADDAVRAGCVWRPRSSGPHPLVVVLPGSGGSADVIDRALTSLRDKAPTWSLGENPGFVLAAIQPRNLHWPRAAFEGAHLDYFFRDPRTNSDNPDVRALDRFIDDVVAEGGVDTRRVHVIGWSNGGAFASLYGISRHETPTPGGHRVAAVVSYAGADPFNGLEDGEHPSCKLANYPVTSLPNLQIHRACDALAACDEMQRVAFDLPPGDEVTGWVRTQRIEMQNRNVSEILLDRFGEPRAACAPVGLICTRAVGLANHLAWPNGLADGSGIDWEPAMLRFLRDHPLL